MIQVCTCLANFPDYLNCITYQFLDVCQYRERVTCDLHKKNKYTFYQWLATIQAAVITGKDVDLRTTKHSFREGCSWC